MWILHGVTWLQVEAMPTCGLLKSASVKPTARSIDRLGARASPSTTGAENWRRLALVLAVVAGGLVVVLAAGSRVGAVDLVFGMAFQKTLKLIYPEVENATIGKSRDFILLGSTLLGFGFFVVRS